MIDSNTIKGMLVFVREIEDLRAFASSVLDKPEDRLYHAADGTWWRREGASLRLVSADPPPGWRKEEE